MLGFAALAVDAQQGAGVPFEEDLKVRRSAVPASEGGEDSALVGQHRQPATLLGQQRRGRLGGDVVGDELWQHGDGDLPDGGRRVEGLGDGLGANLRGPGVLGGFRGLLGCCPGDPQLDLGLLDEGPGLLAEQLLCTEQRRREGLEDGRLARAGRQRDDDEQVHRFHPAGTDLDGDAATGRGGQHGERDRPGEVWRRLVELRDRLHHLGDPAREDVDREGRHQASGGQRGRRSLPGDRPTTRGKRALGGVMRLERRGGRVLSSSAHVNSSGDQ